MRNLVLVAGCTVLCGCASSQLNYNTFEIASNAQDLSKKQVLYNLSKFIDEPNSLPDQVIVASGAVQTVNSLTPTAGATVTKATVTNAAAAVVTTTRTLLRNIGGAGTDQWQQSYGMIMINDGDSLRRMQALYQYAVYGQAVVLERNYPPFKKDSTLEDERHKVIAGGVVNSRLCGNWLFFGGTDGAGRVRPPPANETPIYLGRYRGRELYTTAERRGTACLSNLTLFMQDAAGLTGGSGARIPGGGTGVLIAPSALQTPATADQFLMTR